MSKVSLFLEEEYNRLISRKAVLIVQIGKLPVGYLSRKKIGKNIYYYRQWREGGSVKSAYIPKKNLDVVIADIEHRRKLEEEVRKIDQDLSRIEGSGLIDESGTFMERIIRQVEGSMAIEGIYLTDEDRDRIRNFAFDRSKIDSVVASLVKKHSVARG